MWASDYPPVLEFSSYEQTYACLRHVKGLSETDLRWIFGQTAHKFFA